MQMPEEVLLELLFWSKEEHHVLKLSAHAGRTHESMTTMPSTLSSEALL